MNVLITGSTGFIGTNLYNYFINKDNNNYIFGTTSSGKYFTKFQRNYSDIEKILSNVEIDIIIHLAAVIPHSFEAANFEKVFLPNADMMNNLYKFTLKNHVKKFIYVSSFGSMKNYKEYDIKDYYTLSKIHGEHVCSMMQDKGTQTASLRISSPYGPFCNSKNVMNLFIENALKGLDINVYGSGKREQNFIYIDDIVKAIDLFARTNNKIRGIYNIVSEKNTSMIDLAKIIKDICKSKSRIILGKHVDAQENFRPIYDYFRAYKEVEFSPKYDIYSGLKQYIEWYSKKEFVRDV